MTFEPRFSTLTQLLDHAVEEYGEHPAYGVQHGARWQWTTYAQFATYVANCRAGLAMLGVGRGDRVAVICDNCIEWAILAHATYQRRAIFVPMFEAQREEEWRLILADAGAKVCVVANASIATRVSALREDLLDLQHIVRIDGPEDEENSLADLMTRGAERDIKARAPLPKDIATIIYTSGTTGEPKGVRLSHYNLAANASALSQNRDYGPAPRSMSFLPWAHVFGGHVEPNLIMALGGALAICRNADQLYRELPNVRPTILYAVPRVWNQFYYDIQRDLAAENEMSRHMFDDGIRLRVRLRRGESLSLTERIYLNMAEKLVVSKLKARLGGRLRLAFSGAAPLSTEVAEFMDALGFTIYEGYGLTESSGSTTSNPTDRPKFGSVGKPLPGTTIEIDRSASEGERRDGEIIIRGPGVMQGYHNRPEESDAVLTEEHGLRTGDVGYLDEDGYLFITGRLKDLYKLNSGRYVAPAPLEEKLQLSPFISQCMIYGAGQPYNVALIVVDVPSLRSYYGSEAGSPEELLADRRTRRLLEEEILRCSRDFRTFELVRNFWLEVEPFTPANGMLTPTLKLRRDRVLARYESRLRSLY